MRYTRNLTIHNGFDDAVPLSFGDFCDTLNANENAAAIRDVLPSVGEYDHGDAAAFDVPDARAENREPQWG